MTMELNIPQRLKDLRSEHGYSQDQVAGYCGMTPGRYGHYENGRATPSIETLILLCEFYGFDTINDLLDMNEPKRKQVEMLEAYYRADPEKRKIIDFILNLNC
jgi:transcriptional regulator with XRE-family HTH domain